MHIGHRPKFRGLRPLVRAPDLAIAEEEALLGRETVKNPLRAGLLFLHEGGVRQADAAVVSRVLAESIRAIDVYVLLRVTARVLSRES